MSATTFKLGYADTTILHPTVRSCLRDFLRSSPGMHLSLMEDYSADLLARLRKGEIDAALLRPADMNFSDMQMVHLTSEPLIAATSITAPAACRAEVDLRELAKAPMILPARQREPAIHAAVVELIRRGGPRSKFEHGAANTISLLARTSLNDGVSIVPRTVSSLSVEGIVYRPIRGSSSTIDIVLVAPEPAGQTQMQARLFDAALRTMQVARRAPDLNASGLES